MTRSAAEHVGTFDPGSPAWHAARAHGIGASEIAAVLGLSPWESEFSLWQRKAGRIGPPPESEEMTWGRYLEGPIACRFARSHPELRVVKTGTWRSRHRRWQLANPDRLALGSGHGRIPVEVKWSPYGDGWGKSGTEDIPTYYRCQILQQLDVLGVPFGWMAALVGAEYREYQIWADTLDAAVMQARGERFWTSLPSKELPAGRPPDIDKSDHTFRAIKELHPEVNGRDVEVDFTVALGARSALAAAADAEDALQKVKNNLLTTMGDARRAVCSGETVATRVASRGLIQLRLTKPPKPTGQKVTDAL